MFIFALIRRIFFFLLIMVIAVPLWAIGKTWYTAHNEVIRKADAIVIMGAAQLDGRPGEILEARLKEAKRIFNRNLASKIITVGSGAPGDRFTEAGAARRWLISHGINRRAIIAIPQGRDSYSSIDALSKKSLADVKDIIIVTDPYHCLRSMTMAADKGFIASCSPSREGRASLGNVGFRYLIRESGAYLAYITLGRRGIHISDHVAKG